MKEKTLRDSIQPKRKLLDGFDNEDDMEYSLV